MLSITVKILFITVLNVLQGNAGIITPPQTAIVADDNNVTFFCVATGDDEFEYPKWLDINERIIKPKMIDFIETRNQIDNSTVFNITLTGTPSLEKNNGTKIICVTRQDSKTLVFSNPAQLIIAGPPCPPPTPQLMAPNATTLQLSWSPPFTWLPKYPVLSYNITTMNVQSGYTEINTMGSTDPSQLQVFTYQRQGIATNCEDLVFSVIARNDIGDSEESSTVTGGFPIAPGSFPTKITYLLFFDQHLSPKVEIKFELPHICGYQQASYKITFVNEQNGDQFDVGPFNYSADSNLVDIDVTGQFKQEQTYSFVVVVETLTWTIFSENNTFSTKPPSSSAGNEKNPGIPIVVVLSSVLGACALIVIGTTIVVLLYLWNRKKKAQAIRRARQHQVQPMVANPIYEGAEDPVYDTITDTNLVSRQSSTDSRYQDTPPTVPLMKLDKEATNDNKALRESHSPAKSIDDCYTQMKPAPYSRSMDSTKAATPLSSTDIHDDYITLNQ